MQVTFWLCLELGKRGGKEWKKKIKINVKKEKSIFMSILLMIPSKKLTKFYLCT